MSKQTFQPSKRKHQRVHGFFARMKSRTGILILKRRRWRGRKKLTA